MSNPEGKNQCEELRLIYTRHPDRLWLAERCQQAINVSGGDCFWGLSGELNDGRSIFNPISVWDSFSFLTWQMFCPPPK